MMLSRYDMNLWTAGFGDVDNSVTDVYYKKIGTDDSNY
jgi:hypothetical protein